MWLVRCGRARIAMVNVGGMCSSFDRKSESAVTDILSMQMVPVPIKNATAVLEVETTQAPREGCAYRAGTFLVFLLSALILIAFVAFVLFTELGGHTARALLPNTYIKYLFVRYYSTEGQVVTTPPIDQHLKRVQRLKRVQHVAVGPESVPLAPPEKISIFSPLLRIRVCTHSPTVFLLEAAPVASTPPMSTALVQYDSRNWTAETPVEVWTVTVRVEERTRDDANKTSNNTVTTKEWSQDTWDALFAGGYLVLQVTVYVLASAVMVAAPE